MTETGIDPGAASVLTMPAVPRAFHLLAKPTGAVCNLDCSYCFFLSKEMLYPGSRFRMADELLEEYLRQLIEAHKHVPEVTIAWQGGEPTMMGLDFFRRSVELAERYLRPGQGAAYTIQTNGTLLDEEWAAFFREHGFLVGISIDGPRELHDAYRVNKGGKGSFDQVMRGLAHLRQGGVEWNALTTIHAANGDHGREVYCFLRDECGARFVQFIPIIERVTEAAENGTVPWTSWRDRPLYVQEGSRVTGRSVTAEQYGRFLIDVFEEWVRRDVGEVYVQMFDVALANWVGDPPSLCIHSETCGLALALEHTGDLRPLRRAALQAWEHPRDAHARARRLTAAAAVRARQARDTAALLPRVRRPLRLSRRLPQGPVHPHSRRRGGPQLPLPQLQGVLPPC
jgi:serine-type anaerobic sulfatase-maturating enzyme